MHIHGNQMNLNSINPYSVETDKAIAAQRAAEVRKKLIKSAANIEGPSTPEEDLLISQWMDSDHSQLQGTGQNQAALSGRDSNFG
jgi:hypothetical protein